MQTNSYRKRNNVLFAFAVGGWLIVFVAAHVLSPAIAELHRVKGVTPFTAHMWWRLIPWLAIAVLSIDYWFVLHAKGKETNNKRHVLKYYISLCITFLFVALSLRSMIVLLP